MSSILDKVYAEFKDDVPTERHNYRAKAAQPVPYREIEKEFGSYAKFLSAYRSYCVEKRNKTKNDSVVTKPAKGKFKVVKSDETE